MPKDNRQLYQIEWNNQVFPISYIQGDGIIDAFSTPRPMQIYTVKANNPREAIEIFLKLKKEEPVASIKATLIEVNPIGH